MSDGALSQKLSKALSSRDARLIRRRLPDPDASPSSFGSDREPSKSKSLNSQCLIDFTSNDYLSLTNSPHLRALFLRKLQNAPDVLGSGGSRLLVNGRAHAEFEKRMKAFFCRGSTGKNTENPARKPAALLFNSGFDANVGFFSCIPQPGDAIVYDEYIHASVHDGMRASRVESQLRLGFQHNSAQDLRRVLQSLRVSFTGESSKESQDNASAFAMGRRSVFVSVESLYSMDGTLSPLREFIDVMDEVFPLGNAYLIVDEAHSTGIYGPKGRGRVAQLGLEGRVLARLHTFGKALGASGGAFHLLP
jgi:8-amino-7-oxononanoate synthase